MDWNNGIVEWWSVSVTMDRNDGMVECWALSKQPMMECWNPGIVEWWMVDDG